MTRQPAPPEGPMLTCAGCGQYIAGEYWHEVCRPEVITDANGDELERGEPDYPGQYDEVMGP